MKPCGLHEGNRAFHAERPRTVASVRGRRARVVQGSVYSTIAPSSIVA